MALLGPQVPHCLVLHRPGVLQKPAAEPQVGNEVPQSHCPGPRQPDPQQQRGQAVWDGYHHQRRHKGVPPDHGVVVQKDGQQPQGGAGPSGDGPPQQGQSKQKHGEVQGEEHQQMEGKLQQDGGPRRRAEEQGVDQPVSGHHKGQDPGGKPDLRGALLLAAGGAAGEGHLPLILPLPAEAVSYTNSQQGGGKQTAAPNNVVHSRPSSSILRSSSSSSRLTPVPHRAEAKAGRLPPHT